MSLQNLRNLMHEDFFPRVLVIDGEREPALMNEL